MADSAVVDNVSAAAGSFFLGRFSSSKVTPSSFVIPTTGGSPFLTNSHCPATQLAKARGKHQAPYLAV